MDSNEIKKVLVIGATGGLAQLTIKSLVKKYPEIKILAIDTRSFSSKLKSDDNITYQQVRYSRNNFENIFREGKFDVVYHLGRISHLAFSNAVSKRLDMNIIGTKRILDLSLKTKVKKIIVLSTFHVYGALPDNPIFIKEDSPLRASFKYPELSDVTTMDQLTASWLWKNQSKIETVMLRPCNIIGSKINNAITRYLRTSYVPIPIDFNPQFQFIDERDMTKVLVHSLESLPTGIFNISYDDYISLRDAKKQTNLPTIPFPLFMLEQGIKAIKKLWQFPDYLIDYLKYPCILDNRHVKEHLGDDFFDYSVEDALKNIKK